MESGARTAQILHYGVSPWELEVAHECISSVIGLQQQAIEYGGDEYATILEVRMPVQFGEAFFEWFDYRRWEKVKFLFKEMKRRRGGKNAIKIALCFEGSPAISFVIDAEDRQWFNNAVEKIDFVVELLPYHMDPAKLPAGTDEATYRYDEGKKRWLVRHARAGQVMYDLRDGQWKRAPPAGSE